MTTILLGRICRTCLKKCAKMRKLCEYIKDNLQIESMLKKIVPSYDLDIDDIPLPVEICEDCLNKLRTSFDFVQMCLKTNNELKNIINRHELEMEGSLESVKLDSMSNFDFLEETHIFVENFKKEPKDDTNEVQERLNVFEDTCTDLNIEIVKLENNGSHSEDNSLNEYIPEDGKEDCDR